MFCVTENDIGQIALALKAGASDYMMKPFDRDILEAKFIGVVGQQLSRKPAEPSLDRQAALGLRPMTRMIAVTNLSFHYQGAGQPILRGIDFAVEEGEVYGLLGPSGAGKSTTQRILMGLLRGYSGEVEIFGRPVRDFGRALYNLIGVSFELPAVYLRLTAFENLKLFAALYDRKTKDPRELLAALDLGDAADQRVEEFSKGMKMRLNLARALLHDPSLIFLDEPTAGIDPGRARTIRDLIRSLKAEGKTIFLTTHNMAEAEEICDRVGFLASGRIPVTGTPAALKRQFGERKCRGRASRTRWAASKLASSLWRASVPMPAFLGSSNAGSVGVTPYTRGEPRRCLHPGDLGCGQARMTAGMVATVIAHDARLQCR